MLKTTKAEIDLLTDIDMLLFCEKAIRGALNGIGEKRHMKASNPYLNDHDSSKTCSYGLLLDVVNLYGGTMTTKMPTGNFKWVEKTLNEILESSDDNIHGFFLMVNLLCPQNLHDAHNDFSLAAEKLTIDSQYASAYQQEINPKPEKSEKLMETLFDKKNYVCHYSMLKFLIQQGLKVKKVKRVLQIYQSNFMAAYLELNTKMRQRPQNSEFDKKFF